jgi:signal transduction histidine kinase
MGELIDDLLKLSRLTRIEMYREEVDLSAIARSIADDLHRVEPERRVEFVIPEKLFAYGDPRLLKAALENLVDNAWKFTAKEPQAPIEFGFDAGTQAYYVRDDGAGFDMAYADKLFGPF